MQMMGYQTKNAFERKLLIGALDDLGFRQQTMYDANQEQDENTRRKMLQIESMSSLSAAGGPRDSFNSSAYPRGSGGEGSGYNTPPPLGGHGHHHMQPR